MNKIVVENDMMRFYSTPVPIPVGGSQWSKLFFMFSDEWEDLRKIAQFRQGELKRNVDIASNNFCYVPNEMLPDMCGELSIVGYPQDTASAVVATANSLMLNFVQGFESGGDPAVPPTPDLYQKLLKEFAESGGGGGVQPDWNQNDETQPDYIKNRPFYTGDPVETVLVEESTVSFAENHGVYMAQIQSSFAATVGETYKVYWDGAAYECACVNFNNRPLIGNLSIMGAGSDTGEPFAMVILNGEGIVIVTADTSASHTVSISVTVVPVVKIDEKYLPDSIISDISTAQSTANDAQSTADAAQEVLDGVFSSVATFTFDKQTSGRDTFNFNSYNYYKISDFNPAPEDVISFKGTREGGGELSKIGTGNNCVKYGFFIVVAAAGRCSLPVTETVTYSFTAPSAGLYAQYEEGNQHMTAGTGEFTLRVSTGSLPITGLLLKSSTAGSTKKFKITVNDSGTITATEVS